MESVINILSPRPARLLYACLLVVGFFVLPRFALAGPPPPVVDPHFYDYDSQSPFPVTQELYTTVDTIKVYKITFPSPVVTPYPVNNTVTGFLFLPNVPGRNPVMLVEHEWLPNTLNTEFQVSESLAHAGIAAFLIVQPYSYNRRLSPRIDDVELVSADVPQMVGAMRQGVLDARRAMDWLTTRPDIDPSRMGISGISLGGAAAPLIAGVDRRARVLVTIVGGADVADIFSNSPFFYGLHIGFLYHGVTPESLKRDMAPVEPGNWLHGFDPKNALLFSGRYDVFITAKQTRHLSEDLGGARIIWTPTGHYGSVFAQGQIEDVGIKFLRQRFGMDPAPFNPPDSLKAPTIKLGLLFGGQEGVSPTLAYQAITFDKAQRLSLDGQLTLHGIAIAPSVRIDESNSIGLEIPLLHGTPKPRLFYLFHFVI